MKNDYFLYLNAELGAEFDLFVFEHPDWLEEHVPDGAVVVMQTDDPAFNKWALDLQQERTRKSKTPVVLVHIRKLRQRKSRIVKAEAELLSARKRA